MPSPLLLLGIACLCAIWAVVSAIQITRYLDRHGSPTPFPFMGLFLFRNLGLYSEITRGETGTTGSLYNSYIISINMALVFALLAMGLNVIGK